MLAAIALAMVVVGVSSEHQVLVGSHYVEIRAPKEQHQVQSRFQVFSQSSIHSIMPSCLCSHNHSNSLIWGCYWTMLVEWTSCGVTHMTRLCNAFQKVSLCTDGIIMSLHNVVLVHRRAYCGMRQANSPFFYAYLCCLLPFVVTFPVSLRCVSFPLFSSPSLLLCNAKPLSLSRNDLSLCTACRAS